MFYYVHKNAPNFGSMTSESIIASWQHRQFKQIYWLDGTEDFFIDEVMNYAEHHILNEDQAAFNLSIFYGRDAAWADVLNACRRYPVFSDLQVVLLKEAQQMKDLDKLESYIEKPNESTTFVVSYKGKALDARTKLAKTIKKYGELLTTKKIYDNQLPGWTNGYVQSKGYQIDSRALTLLVDHVGNDLTRITNEVNKLFLNLAGRKLITEDDIELYIGISKDYNVFELQEALSYKNISKAMKIVQFIEANPKALSIQMILPSLHGYFTKLMTAQQMADKSENSMRGLFYNNPFTVSQAMAALKYYRHSDLEKAILLLHHYNLKSVGIDSLNTPPASLMKELVFKIME